MTKTTITKVEHYCTKEAEIAEIFSLVKEMRTALMGNGQKGLITQFSEWKGGVKVLAWSTGIVFTIIGYVLTFHK